MTWKTINIEDIKKGDRIRFRLCGEPRTELLEYTVTEGYDKDALTPSFFTKENGSFSQISAPFEVWVEEVDLSRIRTGDTVTVEVRSAGRVGVYTITGPVFVGRSELAVGSVYLSNSGVTVLEHTPANPEWWSWRLIRASNHVFALSEDKRYHSHGTSYCGCSVSVPYLHGLHNPTSTLHHDDSTRDLPGVRKVSFAVEDGDLLP